MKVALIPAFLLTLSASAVQGQAREAHEGHGARGAREEHGTRAERGTPATGEMRGEGGEGGEGEKSEDMAGRRRHIRLSPERPGTRADTLKAEEVVQRLRAAISKYGDTAAAVADGYVFRPRFKRPPKVYHFTNRRNALMSALRFDPERPTSILYARQPDGTLKLVGAMYTAPKNASLHDLDDRLPLSIARWHQHVNLCLPRRGEEARLSERRDGRPVFGPGSPIATADACESAGGRFTGDRVPWMIHVNALAGDDLGTVFAHNH